MAPTREEWGLITISSAFTVARDTTEPGEIQPIFPRMESGMVSCPRPRTIAVVKSCCVIMAIRISENQFIVNDPI